MRCVFARHRRAGVVGLALFVLIAQLGYADTLYKQDETVIKGLVVEEHHDRIVFSTYEGEQAIFKRDIDEIFFNELEQNYYYIATRFLEDREFERAEKFYAKALEVNPDYTAANQALARLHDIRLKEVNKWKAPNPLHTLKEQAGVSLVERDDLCRVDIIFGKNEQLAVGDAVTKVWDESTKFMNEEAVARRIIGIPGTSARITMQRTVMFSSQRVPWYLRVVGVKKKHILPLQMTADGLTVGTVLQGSQAHQAGLRRGDRIVAIDGESTRYTPLHEAHNLIHRTPAKEIKLTIERDLIVVRQ